MENEEEFELDLEPTFEENNPHLVREYYSPSDTYELYDEETDTFYDRDGDPFRHPREFDPNSEGYTPWGDE